MNNLNKTAIWRSILMVFILFTTSCSSGSPVPTEPSLDKVSLQLQWVTQAQFAGYYVALDKGWYRDEGIDLTIVPGAPDVVPVDLVASGSRDFGTSLLADLTLATQSGKPVVSLAQIQQRNGLLLIARKDSGIAGPEDFVNKRVGVWLGGWEAQFRALIAQAGVDPGDFQLIAQGYSMDSFLNGELDVASAMVYNEYHVVLEQGVDPDELNIIDYADYGLGFPGDTLFTSKQIVEENPDLCTRMVQATLRGWQYAVEHPEEAVEIVLKNDTTGIQTQEHQLSMMEEISKLVDVEGKSLGETNQGDVQLTIDNLLEYGVLSGPVNAQDVYTNQFWELAEQK